MHKRRAKSFRRSAESALRYTSEPLEPRRLLSGVTLITHGFESSSPMPGWVNAIAGAIDDRTAAPGLTHSDFTITVTAPNNALAVSATLLSGSPKTETGETVIGLDWSAVAGISVTLQPLWTTGAVASAVYNYVTTNSAFISSFGNPFASPHLHLIGHSRGGSLVLDLAQLIGNSGHLVDQVTTLDPHPLSGDFGYSSLIAPSNILFCDDYYQISDSLDFLSDAGTSGEPVAGAFCIQLNEDTLDNGGYGNEHSDVHLWYQDTIPLSTTSADMYDNSVSPPVTAGSTWYDPGKNMGPRDSIGYAYSSVASQSRPVNPNPLPTGQTITGTISTAQPSVMYAINAQASGSIQISIGLTNGSSGTPELDLYAPDGTLLSANDSSGGTTISATGTATGTYFLVVKDHFGGVNWSYTLSATYVSAAVAGTSASDTFLLRKDGQFTDVLLNGGTAPITFLASDALGFALIGNGSNDTISLDYSSGNPLPVMLHLNGAFTINGLQGSNPVAADTLDIGRSTVFISYAGPASDPIAAIRGYLQSGFNNGSWTGVPSANTGVITSAAAAGNVAQATAIGYTDSADGFIPGQPANTIELKYTLYGDTSLTGSVGFTDFTRVTQHYNQTLGGAWDTGDFNYDGSVNFSDFTLMTRTYNSNLGNQADSGSWPQASSPASMKRITPTPVKKKSTGSQETSSIARQWIHRMRATRRSRVE